MINISNNKKIFVMLSISLLFRLFIINVDISTVLRKFLCDDAFYYFHIARNASNGIIFSFNDGILTNGFHPLYVVILLPLFYFTNDIIVPVYASLIILNCFITMSGIYLYKYLNLLYDSDVATYAVFLWMFNPYMLFTTQCGMETPIQIYFIIYALYYSHCRNYRVNYFIFGVINGLIFLSRMDGIFFNIVIIIYTLYRQNKSINYQGTKKSVIDLIIYSCGYGLLVFPWLTWSYLSVGNILPLSGAALRILRMNQFSYSYLVSHTVMKIGEFWFNYFIYGELLTSFLTKIIFLLLLVIIMIRNYKNDVFNKDLINVILPTSIFYYLYYIFYGMGMRRWYSLYTDFIITICVSIILNYYVNIYNFNNKRIIYAFTLLIFSINFIYMYDDGLFPQEELKYQVATYISETYRDVKFASFNTGIFQYFTPDLEVINLDGVVNPESYIVNKNDELSEYISNSSIEYIVDSPKYLENFGFDLTSIVPIKTFSSELDDLIENEYVIYQVK